MCYHGRTLEKWEDIMWLAFFWLFTLVITLISRII